MKNKLLILILFNYLNVFSMQHHYCLTFNNDNVPSEILQQIIFDALELHKLQQQLTYVPDKNVLVAKILGRQKQEKKITDDQRYFLFISKAKKLAAINKLFCISVIEVLHFAFKKLDKNFPRMHIATQLNALWWIKENFEKYKDECDEKDFCSRFPIMVAIENDDLLTTAFFFFKQCKNWIMYTKDGKLTDVFKLLLKFEKSKRTRYVSLLKLGGKPMFLAIEKGDKDLLELLLEVGSDPNQQNSNGVTPLIFCLNKDCRRKIDILKTLIKYKADVNLCSSSGCSPIMYAVRNRDVDIVQILLANGATLNVINGAGETAFSLAKKSSDKRMLNLLVNSYKS